MLPYTATVPKVLLPVAGRPFVWWLLERLRSCGFDEVVLCIGHMGELVRDEVGDGTTAGLEVRYAEDGERLLGTAGALRRAASLLSPMFLVTYGDSYLPFDYKEPLADLARHPDALGTMAVFENHGLFDQSNTKLAGEHVAAYEKRPRGAPHDPDFAYIDYGATALRREVILDLPEGQPFGLDAVQHKLASQGTLRAVQARERFFEIGSPLGMADLEREIASHRIQGPIR
jgi:NDP-sugar pyrophosphorylase family protein